MRWVRENRASRREACSSLEEEERRLAPRLRWLASFPSNIEFKNFYIIEVSRKLKLHLFGRHSLPCLPPTHRFAFPLGWTVFLSSFPFEVRSQPGWLVVHPQVVLGVELDVIDLGNHVLFDLIKLVEVNQLFEGRMGGEFGELDGHERLAFGDDGQHSMLAHQVVAFLLLVKFEGEAGA